MFKLLVLAAAAEAHGGHDHHGMVHLEDVLAKVERLPESLRSEFADLVERTQAGESITEFPLLRSLFKFSPLTNSLLAIALMTTASVSILWICPPLQGLPLTFLVSFSAGCLLGNTFFHLLPSTIYSGSRSTMLIPIVTFVLFAYLGKFIAEASGTSGHSHSHDMYAHQHTTSFATGEFDAKDTRKPQDLIEDDAQSTSVEKPSRELRKRTEAKSNLSHAGASIVDTDTEVFVHTEEDSNGTFALINVAADFLHNIIDGAALALAFDSSLDKGILAFVLMCAHEIPHQFGDFALLIQIGRSKASAIATHLTTSSALVFGALIYGLAKKFYQLSDSAALYFGTKIDIGQHADPVLAGTFLYIVTMGVFPELISTKTGYSPLATLGTQLVGLAAGLYLMYSM